MTKVTKFKVGDWVRVVRNNRSGRISKELWGRSFRVISANDSDAIFFTLDGNESGPWDEYELAPKENGLDTMLKVSFED